MNSRMRLSRKVEGCPFGPSRCLLWRCGQHRKGIVRCEVGVLDGDCWANHECRYRTNFLRSRSRHRLATRIRDAGIPSLGWPRVAGLHQHRARRIQHDSGISTRRWPGAPFHCLAVHGEHGSLDADCRQCRAVHRGGIHRVWIAPFFRRRWLRWIVFIGWSLSQAAAASYGEPKSICCALAGAVLWFSKIAAN